VLASRSLIFVALTGLLAASCSSAVVPTYYGGAVIHPPSLTELVPPAPTSLLAEPIGGFSDEAPSYDVVPRQLDDSTLDLRPIAYDVAPRRLEPIPSPPSEPAPAPAPPPATKALLGPLSFISQTLNNCGPASIAEVLAFWGIDRGGPVRRRQPDPPPPDFQFPQMENPQLAEPGWYPKLEDYIYVSFTNAIAFSPTDAMPLTRRAKRLMLSESAISVMTVVLVAGRAVNILR